VVFVTGAIPGETVEARIVLRKRDFARAVVERVVEPSPDRTVTPCPALAAGCGGCDWQHLTPAAQLAAKVAVVRDAYRRTARMAEAIVEPGASVGPWAYRTSMRLAIHPSGRAGLRAVASRDVVALDGCLVAHPGLAEMLTALRVTPGRGAEVSLRVSVATGERTAWLTGPRAARLRGLPDDVRIGSGATIVEVVAGRPLRVSAASFFQSGPAAAEALVGAVGEAAGDAARGVAVDAYGGVGLFSATVLGDASGVTLVELSPSACADARSNLGGAATVVRSSVDDWPATRADLVVADPARTGLGAAAVERLAATGASRLVLVSCDPVAGARERRWP
jgi:23S rRNA (uracil1939-C5)-methyltransferase